MPTTRETAAPPLSVVRSRPVAALAGALLGMMLRTVLGALLVLPAVAGAQDSYEIQVYPSVLVPKGRTMVELHSNYTVAGPRAASDAGGVAGSAHALHETLEITHGVTTWFELGVYVFTSARAGDGWQWVGTHIRPRVSVPAAWHWPVGLSLSQEIGYQRARFAEDTWTWEIRPIIDTQLGPVYVSLNPTLERSLAGANRGRGFEFSPNAVIGVDVTPVVNLALEYYGAFGPVRAFDRPGEQSQQIYPSVNLDLSPDWEFNAGIGRGLTGATERWMVKLILGRRF